MTTVSAPTSFSPSAVAEPREKSLPPRGQTRRGGSLLRRRLSRGHAVAAALMALVCVLATLPVWRDIYTIASIDEEHSHIFLVPLVAAYLVWIRRARFRCTPISGRLVGPLMTVLGVAVSTWGFYSGVQAAWHGGAVLTLLGCVLSVVGKNVLFAFFPAVAVMAFLIPVPGQIRHGIALPLQAWTARTTQAVFETFGQNVVAAGNTLSINGTTLTVAEACNGLRMVFALIMVVFAFAFAMPLRNSVRVLLLILSPLAAIACNVIRIIPTVWFYGDGDQQMADLFHDYSGWAMLPLAFVLLYGAVALLRWTMVPVDRFPLASAQ